MALPLEASAPKTPPCARCGERSECEVWGRKLCYRCTAEWQLKAEADPSLGTGRHEESCRGYEKFTAAWLAEGKRGAA